MKRKKAKVKQILVFKNKKYKIEKIPLNYKITINNDNPKIRLDRIYYSCLENGPEGAHEVAKRILRTYFCPPRSPQDAR